MTVMRTVRQCQLLLSERGRGRSDRDVCCVLAAVDHDPFAAAVGAASEMRKPRRQYARAADLAVGHSRVGITDAGKLTAAEEGDAFVAEPGVGHNGRSDDVTRGPQELGPVN